MLEIFGKRDDSSGSVDIISFLESRGCLPGGGSVELNYPDGAGIGDGRFITSRPIIGNNSLYHMGMRAATGDFRGGMAGEYAVA